jgi:hypothetical protein
MKFIIMIIIADVGNGVKSPTPAKMVLTFELVSGRLNFICSKKYELMVFIS